MRPFRALESSVILVKPDGRRLPTRAVVNAPLIILNKHDPVAIGDIIERVLPSRVTESYRIRDTKYLDHMRQYQCDVERIMPMTMSGERASSIRVGDIVVKDSQHIVVQVGTGLNATNASAADDQVQRELGELKEHVLALLDLDVATKKILWDIEDAAFAARSSLRLITDRIAVLAESSQVTADSVRGLVELAVHQVQASGGLSKSLVRWASTHPISQNMIASVLFELLKGAV